MLRCQTEPDLRILSWNINGLHNKLADNDFINEISHHDIIILTETWITKRHHLNLDIPGFHGEHLFGNKSTDRNKGRTSGAISLYCKHSLKNMVEVVEKLQCGIMWIKLSRDLFYFNEDVYL